VREAAGIFDAVVFLVSPVTMQVLLLTTFGDLRRLLAQPTWQGCLKRMVRGLL